MSSIPNITTQSNPSYDTHEPALGFPPVSEAQKKVNEQIKNVPILDTIAADENTSTTQIQKEPSGYWAKICSVASACLEAIRNFFSGIGQWVRSYFGKDNREQVRPATNNNACAGNVQVEDLSEADDSLNTSSIASANIVLTKAGWVDPKLLNLPLQPQELQDWLDEDCRFESGKKRNETHIVFPIFSQVSLDDGAPAVPLNLETLNQLDKSTEGTGYQCDQIVPQNIGTTEFCWGAMYRDVIPGSRKKPFPEQELLLPQGYEVPGVFEAALGLLWEHRRTGTRCFSDDPSTLTRCKELKEGYRLVVGDFAQTGFVVRSSFACGFDTIGLGAIRKFKPDSEH